MRRKLPAGREDQVGAHQHVGHQPEIRQRHLDLPLQPLLRECLVDHAALHDGIRRRRQVRHLDVVLEREALARQRMLRAQHADDLIVEQRRDVQVLRRREPVADHQVHAALLQRGQVIDARVERMHDQLGLRRVLAQPLDDVGQEERVEIVRRAQVEGARGGGRIERLRRPGDALHRLQALLRQRQQLMAALGRHHAVLAAHEDGVAGDLPQPLEGVADGRLRLPELDGRPGHALLGQQRVQDAQEISVEVVFAVHLHPARERGAPPGKSRGGVASV